MEEITEIPLDKNKNKIMESNNIIESKCSICSLCIYLLFIQIFCCCKKKKRNDATFQELAMERFKENMDIFNIYQIISKYKLEKYEKEEINI